MIKTIEANVEKELEELRKIKKKGYSVSNNNHEVVFRDKSGRVIVEDLVVPEPIMEEEIIKIEPVTEETLNESKDGTMNEILVENDDGISVESGSVKYQTVEVEEAFVDGSFDSVSSENYDGEEDNDLEEEDNQGK